MMTLNRKPLQIIEIDIDYCTRTYGSSPCSAALGATGVRKCYNTFATCQDTANFNRGTLTMRYSENISGRTSDNVVVYPALSKPVAGTTTEINPSGMNKRSSPLGKRASVMVNLKDFTDSDIYTDKYRAGRLDGTAQTDEGGYNPQDRGTHFGKLRTRFPYYIGRPLRILEGFVGDALADMRTRAYIITDWKGPDAAGNVTITAKDVLDLTDDKKAVCPVTSTGKIGQDIDDTSTPTFALTPSGSGSDYPSSGRASIGSEVVSFTRSGDNITLTGRGVDGSDAASHSEGALFQLAYRVQNENIAAVVYDLLVNYGNVDASYINISDWTEEASRWLAGTDINATITKPTGVQKLVAELCQLGLIVWWDDTAQKIEMRAVRPLDIDETAYEVSDSKTALEGSLKIADLDDMRISQCIFWHDQDDATGSVDDGNNYNRVEVSIDASAETANEYNQPGIREIFMRWLGDGNDAVANSTATRLVSLYRNTPRQIEFMADVKDEAGLRIGSLVSLTSRLIQDDTGAATSIDMIVTYVSEPSPNNRIKVRCESFSFSSRYGGITESSRPNYSASTEEQRKKGTYIVSASTLEFADGSGPYVMW